ncbi:MAG: tetratricopeptide repeat protein [Bacteroidales bacterium]
MKPLRFVIVVHLLLIIQQLTATPILTEHNQSNKLDSLCYQLKSYKAKEVPYQLLINISNEYASTNSDSALYYNYKAIDQAKNKTELANGYNKLAILYKQNNTNDSALVYLFKSLTLFKELNNIEKQFKTLNTIGNIYKIKAEFFKSIDAYEQQLQIAINTDSIGWQAQSYANIAMVNYSLGNYEKTMNFDLQALALYEDIQDTAGISRLYNNVGIAYSANNESDKALEYFRKAICINISKNYKNGLVHNYINVACIFDDKEIPDSSIYYYEKALQISKELNDKIREAICYYNIGSTFSKTKRYSQSKQSFSQALELFSKAGDIKGISLVNRGLGQMYMNMKKYPEAIQYAEKSLDIALDISAKDYLIPTYKILSDAHKEMGNFQKAYLYYTNYKEVSDSVFNEKKEKKIQELEKNYEMRMVNQQLRISELDNENKDILIKKKQSQTKSLLAIITLTLTLSIILIIDNFKIRLKNRVLFKKGIELNRLESIMTMENLSKLYNEGNKEPQLSKSIQVIPDPDSPKEILSSEKDHEIAINLKKLIHQQKVYLDSNLTLEKLATMLDTNRTYLSRFINEHYQSNFTNFINDFRIKESCELLSHPENAKFSIEGIAKEVGFNSKSAFNNAFKRFTGLTPSYYIDAIKEPSSNLHQTMQN